MTTGVRELTTSYSREFTERGITGQRVFLYDPSDTTHDEEVPDIGDVFVPQVVLDEETLTGLVCRARTESCVNADKRIVQWTCNYTNEPFDPAQFQSTEEEPLPSDLTNLPMNLEYSSEFVNIRPNDSTSTIWQWEDNSTPVSDPITFKVTNVTLRIKRWVRDEYFKIFNDNVKSLTSTVNMGADPFPVIGGGIGTWLFSSASTDFYRDYRDIKIWQAELIFTYRDPDGTNLNGWNKILRNDGTWQIPKNKNDGSYMYAQGDFNFLFGNEPVSP